ncbi:ras and Rab interactor 3 isoform X1 [Corythoichthys intestinalis]|uniref:ras and Rab interactor 3 isoform X1 n=1 Tax=Corythoichthys intestinalis TaxID=161448 RepID=UPI0025A68D53|nr:ras and Rab interactor 3 isoform X1 [Corythoichthys intestinalis]
MMEVSVDSQERGHTNNLTGAHNPSSLPPLRPCRPKPPPPITKSSQHPSRPPLPPSTPPSLPLISTPTPPLPSNPPPSSLPPPLSPTPHTSVNTEPTPCLTPLPSPTSQAVSTSLSCLPSPSVILPLSSTPKLSLMDQLVGSSSVWLTKGLSQEQVTCILREEDVGVFLVQSAEEQGMMLSVRLPEEQEASPVHNLKVKQHKSFLHLDGSVLVFDDIYKLIYFYCVSRDILAVPLKLPQAISLATQKEELEIISAMCTDFWTSDINQKTKNQNQGFDQSHENDYMYINPMTLLEKENKQQKDFSESKLVINTPESIIPYLLNGESLPKENNQVKNQVKTNSNQDTKFKRPPPRPPSLGSGPGMGLLFSSPPLDKCCTPLTSAADKKEEGKVGVGDKPERKTALMSHPPSRPPVPLQSRAHPLLPPAPLRRTSSRNSTDGCEKGQKPVKGTEKEGEGLKEQGKTCLLGDSVELLNTTPQAEAKQDNMKEKGDETYMGKDKEEDKSIGPPSLVKRPSRPVPQPRKKPSLSDRPGSGSANQNVGKKVGPPSPIRRPDVSLYSPQGCAMMGTDPDTYSNSSTEEEEGETTQEQDQNHSNPSENRCNKIKRTPTTIMLGKARSRLSGVITGLISHDRRLSQRIVELARDPLSYFGNLVKEYRAFTLETMSNHSTSTELLQEIRQMMTQLKSYLLQSTELQAMLEPQHQYSQEKLAESIVEAALCKSVLKPLREPIYCNLEKLHTNNGSLKQLAQNQSVVLSSTTTALGVTTAVPEAQAMEKISMKFSNLHLEYSPAKKIGILLKACKIIYDSMSVSCPGRAHGADDFLPVMMYVLARSNLSDLLLDVEYMMELMNPALTIGEGSYYLTTTYGALEHIKTFDQEKSASRQFSREIQDSIQRWERRRTLNQECSSQRSVQDFLTVCCPDTGSNPKTLGILPTTTIQQLTEECAARFEQDSYILSIHEDGVRRPLAPGELALTVKNKCQPGAYCFIYHPSDHGPVQPAWPGRSCPTIPPPRPPPQSTFQNISAAINIEKPETETSLISW